MSEYKLYVNPNRTIVLDQYNKKVLAITGKEKDIWLLPLSQVVQFPLNKIYVRSISNKIAQCCKEGKLETETN